MPDLLDELERLTRAASEPHVGDHSDIVDCDTCLATSDLRAALSPERVLALVACVRAAEERVRLRKAVRAHTLGEGPLPHHDEIFAADDALDSALSALQHKERL